MSRLQFWLLQFRPGSVLWSCGKFGQRFVYGQFLTIATVAVGPLCFRRDAGTGLDSFMKVSCIRSTESYNSFLQATLKFGWLAGSVPAVAGSSIVLMARYDVVRFVLCSLAFVILPGLAHGRISRERGLFALRECTVGLREAVRADVPAKSAVAA